MLVFNWSDFVRKCFYRKAPAKALSGDAIRYPLGRKCRARIERLEDRCLLSALSINDVSIVEGDNGTTNAIFTITLSAPDVAAVTVSAAATDGTATSPNDFNSLPPNAITFAPGMTSQTFSVTVKGDRIYEGNETFFVNLTNAVNATVSDSQGVGTIVDDDSAPRSLSM